MEIACAKCGSHDLSANNKGWSPLTGMIGSGEVLITCLKCGHKFRPGEDLEGIHSAETIEKNRIRRRNLVIFLVVIAVLLVGFLVADRL